MKKLVLAMACVLSLGLLASCKQGTQDVNVKNQESSEVYQYYGTVSFSASAKTSVVDDASAGTYKWDAAEHKSLEYSEQKGQAWIGWGTDREKRESNYKYYTLEIPYKYCTNTEATIKSYSYRTATINIYKIGNKYYTNNANLDAKSTTANRAEVTFSKGNPESETFTIASLGVIDAGSSNYFDVSNITFTRSK